jgi:hypothetical protein
MGSLRLFRPHHFQQLLKQRQDIGPTIQLSCPSKPFLYPEAGESGPIARAQAVSTPKFLRQPSSGTPDLPFHTTSSPARLLHENSAQDGPKQAHAPPRRYLNAKC